MFSFTKALTTIFKYRTAEIMRKYSTEIPARTLLNNSENMSKAIMACKCKRMIKFAAREKGQFPEYNPKLTYWIEEAKKCGVSEDAINFSINLTLDRRATMGINEIAFPGNLLVLAQYECIDTSILTHKIIKTCNEFDATLLHLQNYSPSYYDQEAVIVVVGKAGNDTLDDSDKKKMSSAGDLQLTEEMDHRGKKNTIVRCNMSHLHSVKRKLLNMDYVVEEAFVGFAPKLFPKVSNMMIEKVSGLIVLLSEMEEIERLYGNIK